MIMNATYVLSEHNTERVRFHGERNGFAYIEFTNRTVVKVPRSWVRVD